MTKWSNEEVIHLKAMIDALGLANGIREFREEHPDRSYNACYLKFKRLTNSEDPEEESNAPVTIPVSEAKEIACKENKANISLWAKIKEFIKNLF